MPETPLPEPPQVRVLFEILSWGWVTTCCAYPTQSFRARTGLNEPYLIERPCWLAGHRRSTRDRAHRVKQSPRCQVVHLSETTSGNTVGRAQA